MKTGKTSSGFEYEIDERSLDDMRILDMVVEVAEGDLTKLSPIVSKVLGEQKEKLYKHLEDEDGRVSIEKVRNEITEIFSQSGAGKNS